MLQYVTNYIGSCIRNCIILTMYTLVYVCTCTYCTYTCKHVLIYALFFLCAHIQTSMCMYACDYWVFLTLTLGFFIIWVVVTVVGIKNIHLSVSSKISFITISLIINNYSSNWIYGSKISLDYSNIPDVHPNPISLLYWCHPNVQI